MPMTICNGCLEEIPMSWTHCHYCGHGHDANLEDSESMPNVTGPDGREVNATFLCGHCGGDVFSRRVQLLQTVGLDDDGNPYVETLLPTKDRPFRSSDIFKLDAKIVMLPYVLEVKIVGRDEFDEEVERRRG